MSRRRTCVEWEVAGRKQRPVGNAANGSGCRVANFSSISTCPHTVPSALKFKKKRQLRLHVVFRSANVVLRICTSSLSNRLLVWDTDSEPQRDIRGVWCKTGRRDDCECDDAQRGGGQRVVLTCAAPKSHDVQIGDRTKAGVPTAARQTKLRRGKGPAQ